MNSYSEPYSSRRGTAVSTSDYSHTSFREKVPYAPSFPPIPEYRDRYWLHILLFLVTLGCSIFAGSMLVGRDVVYSQSWIPAALDGFRYAFALLLFLTVHEFGHYFAAKHHRVAVTLPYYIPSPLFFVPMNIGTFGAVIRIREPIPSTRKLFDIGIAGPLAGFVVALIILLFALVTLPDPTLYFEGFSGHVSLKDTLFETGAFPTQPPVPTGNELIIFIGQTPLYWLLTQGFANVPPMYELHHYPILFAGWLGLFFTALNLLPVGQLDGGHILYALVGPQWHGRLARGFVLILLLSASIGYATEMTPWLAYSLPYGWIISWVGLAVVLTFFMARVFNKQWPLVFAGVLTILGLVIVALWQGPTITQYGYFGWFIWCLLIVAFIKIDHPPVLYFEPLTPTRRVLGILSMIIFILCFSIRPIYGVQ